MNKEEHNIMVYCPECKRRVFDKVTKTNGMIQIKCPHCQKIVEINLYVSLLFLFTIGLFFVSAGLFLNIKQIPNIQEIIFKIMFKFINKQI